MQRSLFRFRLYVLRFLLALFPWPSSELAAFGRRVEWNVFLERLRTPNISTGLPRPRDLFLVRYIVAILAR